ncbi:uncharacterized protein LOC115987667 isoform X2 [Quercus lobata]|uniref:uncharacterized protein LOC115987667 isoform X2 n=1 Tax=Quercus lobata TaxID=97700 RepID=UPI00124615B5|nr:uncharacterized protein LOC115987667 isoform X2 [Quercus lobata]
MCPENLNGIAKTSVEGLFAAGDVQESSMARLNPLVIANALCSTSFVQDSLPTVTYPSTSSSTMHIYPNQSSFMDPLQQFQES